MVRGNEGGDPSAVIFDAIERATARKSDLVLADTAGRLHTKTNLMDELRKVRRVAAKGAGRVTEVLLVIDATTGQNGLTQAREFGDATTVDGVGITGVVLTKLDGSARGGIVFAIETELGIPVKVVGLGESIGDLVPFDPHEFIEALLATD
jgi:fused signal recognition particle receptor